MRQIVLDTETTGLEVSQGHRIIEIGCVELVDRRPTGRRLHHYLEPERDIDEGAERVHGISRASLAGKPRFADVADEILGFLDGAELVIHNAPFDVAFLDGELARLEGAWGRIEERCRILDTLVVARRLHPGQKNSLDALCRRYGVDDSQRDLHGALLDAEILAEVYLAMTGGQATLALGGVDDAASAPGAQRRARSADRPALPIVRAHAAEAAAHEARLDAIEAASGGRCVWRRRDPA